MSQGVLDPGDPPQVALARGAQKQAEMLIHRATLLAALVFTCCGGPDEEHVAPPPIVDQAPSSLCVRSLAQWKATPTWPVSSMMLGVRSYSSAELIAILNHPIGSNGVVAVAQPLIAAKLNLSDGVDGQLVVGAVRAGDLLLIGMTVPPVGASELQLDLTKTPASHLEAFNDGRLGPEQCNVLY